MSFRSKYLFLGAAAGFVFLMMGWSCSKYSNPSGISNGEVVALVGDHKITFGDWMGEMDMAGIFMASLDPNNPTQVRNMLDAAIDREVYCEAAQQAHYSDPSLDETMNSDLSKLDSQIKNMKENLEKKLASIQRIQKTYRDMYKKELLARQYSASQAQKVIVSEKEAKDWYDRVAAQAKQRGQNMPPYAQVKSQIQSRVQMEDYSKQARAQFNIKPNEDVIAKYLASLPGNGQNFMGGNNSIPAGAVPASRGK